MSQRATPGRNLALVSVEGRAGLHLGAGDDDGDDDGDGDDGGSAKMQCLFQVSSHLVFLPPKLAYGCQPSADTSILSGFHFC